MRVNEILSSVGEGTDDMSHGEALRKTGVWGQQGSGAIPFAKSTGRFLINHRSMHVEQPGTYGTWGGAIDRQEDPKDAAERELREEAGYGGSVEMVPLYVFRKGTFAYHNFMAIVEDEFVPHLDWESQGYKWVEWGKWPKPTHFGLTGLVNDPESARIMKMAAADVKKKKSGAVTERIGDFWKKKPTKEPRGVARIITLTGKTIVYMSDKQSYDIRKVADQFHLNSKTFNNSVFVIDDAEGNRVGGDFATAKEALDWLRVNY